MQKCYEEIFSTFSGTHSIFIEKIRTSVVHGFRNDLSIQSNAICHINRNLVLNIDLKDFFPSINFGRVRGFLLKILFLMKKQQHLSHKLFVITTNCRKAPQLHLLLLI